MHGEDFRAVIAAVIELDGRVDPRDAAAAAPATAIACLDGNVGTTFDRINDAKSVLGTSRNNVHAISAASPVLEEAYCG